MSLQKEADILPARRLLELLEDCRARGRAGRRCRWGIRLWL
jgi:hypothetical protein